MNAASENRAKSVYLGKADCGERLQLLFLECQEGPGFVNGARCDISAVGVMFLWPRTQMQTRGRGSNIKQPFNWARKSNHRTKGGKNRNSKRARLAGLHRGNSSVEFPSEQQNLTGKSVVISGRTRMKNWLVKFLNEATSITTLQTKRPHTSAQVQLP